MRRCCAILAAIVCIPLFVAAPANSKPIRVVHEITYDSDGEVDAVGGPNGAPARSGKTAGDTVWVADWTFDAPDGSCDDTGWTKIDNRILNDGTNYWHVDTRFSGINGIVGKAAILSKHDLCWVVPTGYGNEWDYSIICKYRGAAATISFNFVSDSEPGYDFFTVEADSAGASESLLDYTMNPDACCPSVFRDELLSYSGVQSTGSVTGLALPSYGLPAVTHEVYLRFASDGGYADEDGYYPSHWGAGLVVDNVTVTGGLAYSENFEGALNPSVTLANTANAKPFGLWARLYKHITDNDRCGENTSCAWLWSDPQTRAFYPSMEFGPDKAVIHSWLDNIIVSPWVSLAGAPNPVSTVLSWRRNASQRTSQGDIAQNWSVRTRTKRDNTDTPVPGDSIDCAGTWAHSSSWNTFNSFVWGTNVWDMSAFVSAPATDVQLRVRVADTCFPAIFDCERTPYNPGPGPFLDRIRIGQRYLSGPVLNAGADTRSQAQDCFPTKPSAIGAGRGEHFEPETDTSAPLYPYLFGTCAFSAGADLGIIKSSPNLITGDSIYVESVTDARGAGGITSVKWYGAIVAGPHAGKAPAPYAVGANGFFEVQADSAKGSDGAWVAGRWCVDLDDTYFRGGDQLDYFWYATDAAGGGGSLPAGITAATFPPASVSAAQAALDGLYEVSFLPAIQWDPGYLARIAGDAHGDLAPTAAEVAGSSQRNCILYYQHSNAARRSGQTQRTTLMYALDRIQYHGLYDVYDVQGYGNTNNQLGGRATLAQASGYALIIEDDGRSNLSPNIPDGSDLASQKINQAQWYRSYLAQGLTSRHQTASLWLVGENTAYEKPTNPLFTTDFGLTAIANDQSMGVNPEIAGIAFAVTWDGCTMAFTGDRFTLNGGCPNPRAYDAATASGTAVLTHKYQSETTLGSAAVVVNRNAALHWNTVWCGFGMFDIRNTAGMPSSPDPLIKLTTKLLLCLLPNECRLLPGPLSGAGGDDPDAIPPVSELFQNTPNPFNPTTTIRFDLAHEGHVALRIYDVAGHVVKTLVDGKMAPGRNISVVWSGSTASGARAPSGVYFYRLVTDDYTATKKMVLMK